MRNPNTYCHRMSIVVVLIFGLILAPIIPSAVMAAEQGPSAAGSTSEAPSTGSAGGVDVSGSSGKASPSGKGALAPPPRKSPPSEPATVESAEEKKSPSSEPKPVKKAEEKKTPKAIGASAGKAGPATAEPSGGMSMGWKITAGVLGAGLLLGLAGGGGGGGGGTTPAHTAP